MALSVYTSYEEIRGVLGIASNELPDAVIGTDLFWFSLKHEFSEVDSGIIADIDLLLAKPSPTDEEVVLIEASRMFATFAVANQLLDSLPMFAPKSIIEGKSDVTRFSDSPYAKTIESVAKSYLRFKKILKSAYTSVSGGVAQATASPVPLISGVAPTYDPVTGI